MKTYTEEELRTILILHEKWVNNKEGGQRADLSDSDLSHSDLSDSDLSDSDLSDSDLSHSDLSYSDLSHSNLFNSNLSGAGLSGANFSDADLSHSDLSHSNLFNSNLFNSNLSYSNLSDSDLSHSNLSGANFSGANFSDADLSQCKGLLNAKKWLFDNFQKTNEGLVVYKAIGSTYRKNPENWIIEEGSYIEEIVNAHRTNECGCGVNFGTLKWIETYIDRPTSIWECLIHYEDFYGIVVPYNTDGKARCERLQLIKKIA
jgi:Pentapeptide repeats (8 copies)